MLTRLLPLLVLYATLFLIATPAHANTTWVAAGVVSGTWSVSGSPYMIYDGWIEVPESEQLTIQPGVKVYFDGPFLLVVNGLLTVNGTPEDSVLFTAFPRDTFEIAFRGVYFGPTADDASQLTYAIFEHARGPGYASKDGGAIQINGSSPHFDHCLIHRNRPARGGRGEVHSRRGGGAYLSNSNALFTNCVFTDNNAGFFGLGGAVFCADTTAAQFVNCIMREDTAGSGGAIAVRAIHVTSPTFFNCEITHNFALYNGGGVHSDGGQPEFDSCRINDNLSTQCGGAFYAVFDGSFICRYSEISANESFWGGALFCYESGGAFGRCVIRNNVAGLGGALYAYHANPLLLRSTVAHNISLQGDGAGAYLNHSSAMFTHTIIAYNYGGEGVYFLQSPEADIGYCDIAVNSGDAFGYFTDATDAPPYLGDLTQVNANLDSCDEYLNLYSDPQFVDGPWGDYNLNWSSPCIDAGSPIYVYDPDGTLPDIGAFYRDALDANDVTAALPQEVALGQNYPNPFNAATRIEFDLPRASAAELVIYDLLGREVMTLLSGQFTAGRHSVNVEASLLPSGVYIYRLKTEHMELAKKMVILK